MNACRTRGELVMPHAQGRVLGRVGFGARRSSRALGLVRILMLSSLFLLFAMPAAAQDVQVYATYSVEDTGPVGAIGPPAMQNGLFTVHLWASGGETISSGPVCTNAGTGSALCGIAFSLTAVNGFEIRDFVGNPAFDSSASALPFRITFALPGRMNANNFDLGTPGVGNRWLGMLTLFGGEVNPNSQLVVSGKAIGANLEMRPIAAEALVVPEPMTGGGLAIGAIWLVRLAGRRRRRPLQADVSATE